MYEISSLEQLQEILQKKSRVVVDFYASWCKPCKELAKVLPTYEIEHKNVTFLKVNVDENEDIAETYDVSSLPTLLFVRHGQIQGKVTGNNETLIKQELVSL